MTAPEEGDGRTLIGVDGCRAGWIAAIERPGTWPTLAVFAAFADLLDTLSADALVAVDMPIGLPDRIEGPGRVAEQAVRPLLGARQSSVFSIPARSAVEIDPGPHIGNDARAKAHTRASETARATSTPPRAVSRQGFMLFPRILELDRLLRANPIWRGRIFESHPEVAFAVLNGGVAMARPKKIRGQVNPDGMAERRALLLAKGLPAMLIDKPCPRGAGEDDRLDACAMLLVARRIAEGRAVSYPDPPGRDAFGLPIAIWA